MIPRQLQITIVLLLLGVLLSGIYVLQLRRAAEERAERADSSPMPPPVAGPSQPVTLMVAYDDDATLRREQTAIALPAEDNLRGREVLRALFNEYLKKPSPHPLAPGAEVREVYLLERNLAVIDTNAAFADRHPSGILVEELTVASMIETLAANLPAITRVKILVEGKERETLAGHADLTSFYEVAAFHQQLREMN